MISRCDIGDLLNFFKVIGHRLRWRLSIDPHRAVQKCVAVGCSSVNSVRANASCTLTHPAGSLNQRLKAAGFPTFTRSALRAIESLGIILCACVNTVQGIA